MNPASFPLNNVKVDHEQFKKGEPLKIFIIFIGLIFPCSAHAYLDPGTGSIILQGLIAAIAAGLVVIKTYWYRIKTFFGKTGAKSLADEESTSADLDSDSKN